MFNRKAKKVTATKVQKKNEIITFFHVIIQILMWDIVDQHLFRLQNLQSKIVYSSMFTV